jgi:transmembrane sensor
MKPMEDDGRLMAHKNGDALLERARRSRKDFAEVATELAVGELVKRVRPWGDQTREERIQRGREAARREARKQLWVWGGGVAVAAAVLLAVGIGMVGVPKTEAPPAWTRYSADAAQPKVVKLKDGTTVHLSVNTSIEVMYTQSQRRVRMSPGEAFYEVARDESRRFRIDMTPGAIEVLGTRFEVNFDGANADVNVAEGHVALLGTQGADSRVDLLAGQEGVLLAGGVAKRHADNAAVASVSDAESADRTFIRTPLGKIAEAFNKHRGRPIFEVTGSACKREIAAGLDVSEPQDLVSMVEDTPELALEKRGEVTRIWDAADGGDARNEPCR